MRQRKVKEKTVTIITGDEIFGSFSWSKGKGK